MAKTANIGRLAVNLTANTADYSRKLKNAEKDAKKSTNSMSSSFGKMAKKVPRSVAAIGVAAAAAAVAAKELADAYVQLEKELRSVADVAGLTTNELKANAYALADAGLSAEKLGDIYKDVQDKIGEFSAAGSGAFQDFVDVMKMTKGQGKALAQELQYLSGPDILQYLVKEMDKANVSTAQMTFVMESLGSDSARTTKLLAENAGEVARLKDEYAELSRVADATSVKSFEEATKQSELFYSNLGALATDSLAPVMEAYTAAVKALNAMLPESAKSKNKDYGSNIRKQLEAANSELGLLEKQKKIQEELLELTTKQNQKRFAAVKELSRLENELEDMGYQDRKSGAADHKIAQVKAQKDVVNNLTAQTESLHAELNEVSKLIKTIPADLARTTGKDAKVIESMFGLSGESSTDKVLAKYQKMREDFENTYHAMYGDKQFYKDAIIRLEENLNSELEAINDKARAEEQAKQDEANQAEMDRVLERNEKLKAISEQYAETMKSAKTPAEIEIELNKTNNAILLEELENTKEEEAAVRARINRMMEEEQQRHADSMSTIARVQVQSDLQNMSTFLGAMGDVSNQLANIAGENEAAARIAFIANQSIAFANAIVNTEMAATKALAEGGTFAGMPLANVIRATGYASAGIIAGQTIGSLSSGQFHGGTDEVPTSMDNKSFILKAGERVVQPEANKDLTAFLKNGSSNNGGSSVVSSVTINGNVTDEKWFDAQLVKHRNTIAGSVRKVEKERPKTKRR